MYKIPKEHKKYIPKEFLRDEIKILNSFENEHWELFIIYNYKGVEFTYITGDELDWEFDWFLNERWLVFKTFVLSIDEKQKAINYFNKNKKWK